jgi:tRNA-dihydrouridine synthase
MSCHGNNATPPGPAVAPGVEDLSPQQVAADLAARWPGGVDPRVRAILPAMEAPFFQAGLAGYSDAAMRIVARRHGAPLCVTEALLDRMLLGGGHGFDKADLDLIEEALPCGHEDHPLVGQIIGADPDEMAAGAMKMIEQGARPPRAYRDMAYGEGGMPTYVDTRWAVKSGDQVTKLLSDGVKSAGMTVASSALSDSASLLHHSVTPSRPPSRTFAAIDVNLACPVKKIDRKNRGGHWLREPQGAIAILKAVRAAVPASIPCTVKLRRAYDDTPEMARNFEVIFDAAMAMGYAWATVHARTVEQKYVGPSRWTFLRDLASRRSDAIIFGSGDVWNVSDIFRMLAYTGVSGVSVARGCIGNPWIFRQARDMLDGRTPRPPTLAEQRAVLLEHFELSIALNGERVGSKMMRKFGIKFAQHHPRPEDVKARMVSVSSVDDWRGAVDDLYAHQADGAGGV